MLDTAFSYKSLSKTMQIWQNNDDKIISAKHHIKNVTSSVISHNPRRYKLDRFLYKNVTHMKMEASIFFVTNCFRYSKIKSIGTNIDCMVMLLAHLDIICLCRLNIVTLPSFTGEKDASNNPYLPYLESQKDKMVYDLYGKGKAMLGWDVNYHAVWLHYACIFTDSILWLCGRIVCHAASGKGVSVHDTLTYHGL